MANAWTALAEGCFALVADINESHWTDDCPAGLECGADAALADRYPVPNARPVTDAYLSAVANFVLLGAHLRGIATTLTAGALPSVLGLSRIAAAAACYTSWLLEPDQDPLERARRNVNAHLTAIADRQRIHGRDRNMRYYTMEDAGRQQFMEWGRHNGLEPLKLDRYDDVQRWALASRTPNEMELVRFGLDGFEEVMPDAIYRLGSVFVHSTGNAMLLLTSGIAATSEHDVPLGRISLSVGRVALFSAATIYATHRAVTRALDAFGRNSGSWSEIVEPIFDRFRRAAQDELALRPAIFG